MNRLVAHVHICRMIEVASRELRHNTRALLRIVAGGEDVVITVDGQPVARLRPLNSRPRWINSTVFARRLARHQADPGLRRALTIVSPDTTGDLPL